MNNRGISAVVATVLIILITVAAVSIIWIAILPVMKESLASVSATQVDLSILKEGYTVFDNQTRIASVQIKRGADDSVLKKLKVIFYINGSSESVVFDEIPNPGEAKTYLFNFSMMNLGIPYEVAVAPVFEVNGRLVEGDVVHKADMVISGLRLTVGQEDYLREKGSVSTGGSSSSPGEVSCSDGMESINGICQIALYNCTNITEGGRYYLKKDLFVADDCFRISANNVKLNLGGHIIEGDGLYRGIWVWGYNGTWIQNGVIKEFTEGIVLSDSKNNLIKDIIFINNSGGSEVPEGGMPYVWEGYGLKLEQSLNNTFVNLSFMSSNFAYGVYVGYGSNYNYFNELVFNDLGGEAISFKYSNYSFVENVFMNSTGGIGLTDNSAYNNFSEIVIKNGYEYGVTIFDSNENNFIDVELCDNVNHDFYCYDASLGFIGGSNKIGSVSGCDWIGEEDYESC